MRAALLILAAFTLSAQADTLPILPPLSFGSHADLGYIEGINPAVCHNADGAYSSEYCGATGYAHVYVPEAESPDGHWVGVAVYDLDIDAVLWLWHDGEYAAPGVYGPLLTLSSIDNNGVAKGYASPCYDRAGMGASAFSSDVGCIPQPSFEELAEAELRTLGIIDNTPPASVPEPSSLALLAALALGIAAFRHS